MKYESIPIIKLEMEHMRHTIMYHLGLVGSEPFCCVEAQKEWKEEK